MVNPDDGYIGIRSNGKNKEELQALHSKLSVGLTKFKIKIYLIFIIINVIWIIISVLMIRVAGNAIRSSNGLHMTFDHLDNQLLPVNRMFGF